MSQFLPSAGSLGAFLQVLLGFGFIIFVHELGHFLVAKAVGIKVTQFAIGFGGSIFAWRKGLGLRLGSTEKAYKQRVTEQLAKQGVVEDKDKPFTTEQIDQAATTLGLGETEYRLNYVPLGGYVKMLGQEDLDPTKQESDPRSFTRKPAWARAAVLSAGVLMNLIFGLIFFIAAFRMGVLMSPPLVGAVAPGSPAAIAYPRGHQDESAYQGLRSGDQIVSLDGKNITDFTDLAVRVALAEPDSSMPLVIRRPIPGPTADQTEALTFDVTPRSDIANMGLLSLGVQRPLSNQLVQDALLQPELAQQGVKGGMKVVQAGSAPVSRFDQFDLAVSAARGTPVPVTFQDPESLQEVTVQVRAEPVLESGENLPPNLLGMVPPTQVTFVVPDSPAQAMGFAAGDVIAQVNDQPWPTIKEMTDTVKAANGQPVRVQVQRGGELVTLTPQAPQQVSGTLGVALYYASELPRLSSTLPNTPAQRLSAPRGSTVLTVDGQPIANWTDLARIVQDYAVSHPEGGALAVTYEDNLPEHLHNSGELSLTAEQSTRLAKLAWHAPANLRDGNFEFLLMRVVAKDMGHAIALGLDRTQQFIMQTYVTLARLFQNSVKLTHLSGPVGIFHQGTRVAQEGFSYLLLFFGLLSVNLAVINFLPIPITDGGHILFLIIEKIKGSPVSPRIQTAAFVIGLVLIGGIFLFTLVNDAMNLLG